VTLQQEPTRLAALRRTSGYTAKVCDYTVTVERQHWSSGEWQVVVTSGQAGAYLVGGESAALNLVLAAATTLAGELNAADQ
jgi:hypothetical protein